MSEQTSVSTSNTGSENQAGITPAAPITPAAAPAAQASAQATTPAVDAQALAQFREAVVKANPDAIPELIAGHDFAGIQASVEGAKAAFARIANAVKTGAPAQPAGVPAGGAPALPLVDVESLSSEAKIAHGLKLRQAKSNRAA